jgi:hypothetical protein
MNIEIILKTALTLGVTLYIGGGKLLAQPASRLTIELREAIKSHKTELIELLTNKPKRAIVQFKLIDGHGGTVIGDSNDTTETLIDVLRGKFGNRLDSITNG